jgi:predicted dehydrogenase
VEDFRAPDDVTLHLDHANGAHTQIETSFTYTHRAKDPMSWFHYHLIGTEGVILYDRDAGRFEVHGKEGTDRLPWSHEKNFPGMYADWFRALETGDLGEFPSARDGILATRIASEGTEQAIARRSI